MKEWFSKEAFIEAFGKRANHGYMRCVKLIKIGGRQLKVSLDFMEGQVTGRTEKDIVILDEKFVSNSWRVKIKVADKKVEFQATLTFPSLKLFQLGQAIRET